MEEDIIEDSLNFDDYPLTVYSKEDIDELSTIYVRVKEFMDDFDLECQDILNNI